MYSNLRLILIFIKSKSRAGIYYPASLSPHGLPIEN